MNIDITKRGISQALQQFNSSAEKVAAISDNQSNVELDQEIANQIEAEHALKANVRTAKVANDMTGELLDIVG